MVRTALAAGFVAAWATASLAGSPSSDGWQFAKWGMNSAHVHAASHGAVRKASDGDYDMLAGGTSMGKFKFSVNFDYAAPSSDPGNLDPKVQQLNGVMLDLDRKSGTCADLQAYLRTLYGKPARIFKSGPAGDRWSRKDIGDVQYSTWDGKDCSVMYMAFGASNQ